uniref:SH3 domain binding glutamate-rich protein like 2 n=1 Tax=Astyanax mexicanus TaxID=7994 RepID=A0A8B9L985_ASTMX
VGVQLYVASQVKKNQQAVVGFLEANRISFEEVDITMLEEQRLWMYQNIPEEKRPEKGNPLPPQIFNETVYCNTSYYFFSDNFFCLTKHLKCKIV